MPSVDLDSIKETRVSIKVTALGAIIAFLYYAGIQANTQYVHWHDTRYAKRSEIITLAQAEKITEQFGKTNDLAIKNSDKLDAQGKQLGQLSLDFNTYAASTLVSQAKSDLRAHINSEREHTDRTKWLEDKAKLEAQLQKAEEYRACVIESKNNCSRFLLNP